MNKKRLRTFVNFVFLILISLLGVFSYCLISSGINSYIEKKVSYSESSDVDYKVYYYENNFFDTEYLEKDKTYISSLIDYIDLDLSYRTQFSNIANGEYVYYVNGTIIASNPNDENEKYWTKTVNIIEPKIVKYSEKNGFDFLTNIKIDYQLYNNMLKEFKSEYNLAFVGKLKIELFVESQNKFLELNNPIKLNSVSEVSIPLTQQTINLTVDYSNVNKTNVVVEKEKTINIYDKICIALGCLLLCSSLYLLYIWFKVNKKYLKSQSKYNKEKRKILKTYNTIIVNVQNIPNLKNMNIIEVQTFDELLDAQSEVRMPINFAEIKYNKLSEFVLINNKMAWIYTLIDEEYKNKKNN